MLEKHCLLSMRDPCVYLISIFYMIRKSQPKWSVPDWLKTSFHAHEYQGRQNLFGCRYPTRREEVLSVEAEWDGYMQFLALIGGTQLQCHFHVFKTVLCLLIYFSLLVVLDINECDMFPAEACLGSSTCFNTDGSYACLCDRGSTYDGTTCVGELTFRIMAGSPGVAHSPAICLLVLLLLNVHYG